MGMGIVSDAEFDLERNRVTPKREESNSPSATINPMPTPGRNQGDINVPESLRKVIGETAITDGPAQARAMASAFGISESSASAYGVGATSTATYHDRPSLPHLNKARLRIQGKASKKLREALDELTPQKLSEAKAGEIASVARAMAAIVKDMEPEVSSDNKDGVKSGPTFVFMAPPRLKEDVFEAKYVRE
jgi:hypothetical protein